MKIKAFSTIFLFTSIMACEKEENNTATVESCFSYSPSTDISVGQEISFTNCSENATEYLWEFGDGTTSSQQSPAHTYSAAGDYDVKLTASGDNGQKESVKTITVGSGSFMKIDGVPYSLTKGELHHWEGKWHSIFLYDGLIDMENETGQGNLVCIDILAGAGPMLIEGTYTMSNEQFDGDSTQIAAMDSYKIYNGFCAFANDFNVTEWDDVNNAVDDTDTEDYKNFFMEISKDGGNYLIEISVTVNSKLLEVYYHGELTVQ